MQRFRISYLLATVISFLVVTLGFAQQDKPIKSSKDYVNIVKYYRYLNPDSAKYFVDEGVAKAEREKDNVGLAALLNQSGMIDDNAARFKESRNKYLRSEQIYREVNDSVGLASTLIRLGVVEQRKANYDRSLRYFFDALKISERTNNKMGVMEARNTLSETYFNLGDYENSIKQLEISQGMNSQMPLSNLTLNMYVNLGKVYTKLKQYDTAINYIEIGLSKSNKVEFNGFKITLLNLLAKVYSKKGDVRKAISLHNQALDFSREIKNVIRELTCLLDLATIYQENSIPTALGYLKNALKISEQYRLYNQQVDILNTMSLLYEKQKDFKTALTLKNNSYNIAREFYYDDMKAQISSLETAYDKEKANVQLRELQLKNNQEKQSKNIILGVAAGIFLLLIITAGYFYRAKDLNKLLKKANLKLEESNRQKDKFFSIVAHDIRSPLVSTTSILKLIAEDELEPEVRKDVVSKLILHCDSSLDILDKLLKWGQMQIKGVKLRRSDFNPTTNINENIALLREAIDQKHIEVNVDVPENLLLKADPDHFGFVIRNLMANAIKFTPKNGKVKLEARPLNKDTIQFDVIDNGVGISASRIKTIFELSSVSTKGTSQEEGTSLGLIICKEFILANHGDIDVHSQMGKGTKFSFTLKGELAKV